MLSQRLLQPPQTQRLRQKIIRPCLLKQRLGLRTHHRRNSNNRSTLHRPFCFQLSDLPRSSHAVFNGHRLIHEDSVDGGIMCEELVNGFLAVGGEEDGVAEGEKHFLAELLVNLWEGEC
jgi:hypothetical protein